MSLLWSLKKFFDNNAFRLEKDEKRRLNEVLPPDVDPTLLEEAKPMAQPEAASYRCRICGHEGPEPKFCPECLAETMKRV
jgi:hypothetical protein